RGCPCPGTWCRRPAWPWCPAFGWPSEPALHGGDGCRGADVSGLVAGHLADGPGDVVGRAVHALRDRRRRILESGGDLAPRLALQDPGVVDGALHHELVAEGDERVAAGVWVGLVLRP